MADACGAEAPDGPDARALYLWVAITVAVPAVDIARGRSQPIWLAALGLAALIVLFLATIRATFGERGSRWPAVALLVTGEALALALVAFFGGSWYTLVIVPSLACGVVLVARAASTRTGVAALLALAAAAALVGWPPSAGFGGTAAVASLAFTPGLVVWTILRLFGLIHELRAAREELARLAVADERLRFARDLHDLLGHTLSVMVVKSEAIRRLAHLDAESAAAQAADIETVGRRALVEVREAVTGYRAGGLAAELDGARSALGAAGIDLAVRESGPPLPTDADRLLGWVVREGATNVVRHSHAGRCEIEVRHAASTATVEIRDDGAGPGTAAIRSGLRGLHERLSAAGGRLDTARGSDGGFVLTAVLPVDTPDTADADRSPYETAAPRGEVVP